MTPERWQQVKALFQSAVEVEANERAAFLDKACAADPSLRRHVEALIASHEKAPSFLESPKLEVLALPLIEDEAEYLPGQLIGPYEVLQEIGRGGMGEVYKAKDSRLNRTVAIKILPHLLSERVDLRQRFEREARAIASLNHPNICALYDIGRQDEIDFLVMEYLEGETLSKRLKKGPLPTDQLLRIAIEIATALDQAHRHGVTHRDLKPGNIMLTKTGAKLLDFGLAKQSGSRPPDGERSPIGDGLSHSESLTEEGMILGTLEYMAPEQVEGKGMDARTDIFAFGVVMYEMATGRKAFEGESRAGLTAAILTSDPPPISKIQPMTPPALERLVKKCMTKDPDERWQSAGDLASELKWIAEAGGAISAMTAGAETAGLKSIARGRRRELLYGVLTVAFLAAAIVSTVFYLRVVRTSAHAIISEIPPPEKTQFNFGLEAGGWPMLSPDGAAVAFSATDANGKTMLWVRSFDSLAAHPLPGTEGGTWPFWSPDSRKLGFFAVGKLKTLEVLGGPARIVADAPDQGGGSWNREGTLLFVADFAKGLYQVAASGGAPVLVLELDKSKYTYCFGPKFLPDGKHFIYNAVEVDFASNGYHFASLDGKENRLLLKGKEPKVTYGSGYLLYLLDKTLMAQAIDPERGQLKGDAHPVAERIDSDSVGYGFYDVSENGVLIYQAGDLLREKRITWFDRAGKELSAGERGSYDSLRLSPDGAKLAYKAGNPTSDIWVDELARGVHMRLTNDPGIDYYNNPTWSPDGSRILFVGSKGIYQMNSNGAGGMELLLPLAISGWPTSWSPDGRFILFVRGTSSGIQDVCVLPLTGDSKSRLFVHNAFDGQFSPDGRWVAYTSMEPGKFQICVVPFDATKVLDTAPGAVTSLTGKYQISASGGVIARWRGDGKEIFYFGPDKQMMATEVDGRGISFAARKEQALFKLPEGIGLFDVAPDGKRFVMTTQKVNPNTPLTLVQNWTALLGNKP